MLGRVGFASIAARILLSRALSINGESYSGSIRALGACGPGSIPGSPTNLSIMVPFKHTPTVFLKYGGVLMAAVSLAARFGILGITVQENPLRADIGVALGLVMLVSGLTLTAKMQRSMASVVSTILLIRCILAGLYALAAGTIAEPVDLVLTSVITIWGLSAALRRPEPLIVTSGAVENA